MRLGVLDIGSNTVHLLLVDAFPGARPTAFASYKQQLSLVRYLDPRGAVTDEGRQALLSFVDEAVDFARRHRAEDLLAFCTSALREALNGPDIIREVERLSGVKLQELTGEEESAMTFFAARRWFGWGVRDLMVLDIGGGSFEVAIGRNEFPDLAVSMPLGAARLTKDFLPGDPPKKALVGRLRDYIAGVIEEPLNRFANQVEPDLVVATSKTFRTLARMSGAASEADGPFLVRTLSLKDVRKWAQKLVSLSFDERAELDGVSPIRAPQLLAGAVAAEMVMEKLGVKEVRICPWALREGLLMHRFDRLLRDYDVIDDEYAGVGDVDALKENLHLVPPAR